MEDVSGLVLKRSRIGLWSHSPVPPEMEPPWELLGPSHGADAQGQPQVALDAHTQAAELNPRSSRAAQWCCSQSPSSSSLDTALRRCTQ